MTIFFIRHETDYGPFFSSKEKVAEHLKADAFSPLSDEELEKMLAGKHPYCNVVEVKLDDTTRTFDG